LPDLKKNLTKAAVSAIGGPIAGIVYEVVEDNKLIAKGDNAALDQKQTGYEIAGAAVGLIPGVGDVANFVVGMYNASISLRRGNKEDAIDKALDSIPIVNNIYSAAKAVYDFSQGNTLGGILGIIGAIPVIGKINKFAKIGKILNILDALGKTGNALGKVTDGADFIKFLAEWIKAQIEKIKGQQKEEVLEDTPAQTPQTPAEPSQTPAGQTPQPAPQRSSSPPNPMPDLTGNLKDDFINTALSQKGVPGTSGKGSTNPYSPQLNVPANDWCGDFVAWNFRQVGLEEVVQYMGNNHYPYEDGKSPGWNFQLAPNWANTNNPYLTKVDVPQPGDVIVWSGHVAIVTDVKDGIVTFVGGNQSGAVTSATQPSWWDSNQTFRGYFRHVSF